jgi:hypothetical protein
LSTHRTRNCQEKKTQQEGSSAHEAHGGVHALQSVSRS